MRSIRTGALVFLATALLVGAPPDWQHGKLLNLDIGSQMSMKHGKSKTRRVFTFTVEGLDKVYDGVEVGKKIHLDVNGPVEYAVEKDHLYIKDSGGKTHKLDLLKTTRKG